MGVCAGIDHDGLVDAHGVLDLLHELALVVRLEERNVRSQFPGQGRDPSVDVVKGEGPVNIGLPLAEQIKVWTVNHQDLHDTPRENKNCREPQAAWGSLFDRTQARGTNRFRTL